MNRLTSSLRPVRALWLPVALALVAGCAGGGGASGPGGPFVAPSSLVASFDGDTAPSAPSISLEDFVSTDAGFEVRVRVNGVQDFFGAAFRINYNPAVATFVPTSIADLGAGSIVPQGGLFFANEDPLAPGIVSVEASLQGSTVTGLANANGRLITIAFQATALTSASPFTLDRRVVTVCPVAEVLCTDMTEPPLAFGGGQMSATP